MLSRSDYAKVEAKIEELYEKHRDPETGSYKTDAGTSYDLELREWLEEQSFIKLDCAKLSRQFTRQHYETHRAFKDVLSKPDMQLSLWEDEGLIALSLDNQESIEMGEASKEQWMLNMRVIQKQFGRQAAAFAKTSGFQGEVFDSWADEDKQARDVANRIKSKSAKGMLKEAAD